MPTRLRNIIVTFALAGTIAGGAAAITHAATGSSSAGTTTTSTTATGTGSSSTSTSSTACPNM